MSFDLRKLLNSLNWSIVARLSATLAATALRQIFVIAFIAHKAVHAYDVSSIAE